jgi:hypothetical protein
MVEACLLVAALGAASVGCGELDSSESAQEQTAGEGDRGGTIDEQGVDETAFEAGGPIVAEPADDTPLTAAVVAGHVELRWPVLPSHNHFYSCSGGSSSSTLYAGHTPYWAGNGCNTRVWFYQWLNHTGFRTCVNPHTAVRFTRAYKSFVVSPLSHC